MNKFSTIMMLLILPLLWIGCSDGLENLGDQPPSDLCHFESDSTSMDASLSDNEAQVLSFCSDHLINDVEEIKANLIGRWQLEGFALTSPLRGQKPCAIAIFESNRVTYHYQDAVWDTAHVAAWDLVENVETTSAQQYELQLFPETMVPGLHGLDHFCASHMYLDHRHQEGTMHFFTKIE